MGFERKNEFPSNSWLTFSSNAPIPIPDAAPDPAKPMKCPDPILLAKSDAPTYNIDWYVWTSWEC